MYRSRLHEEIAARATGVHLVDTHEHLMSEEERGAIKLDLFYWFSHYASSDLVSSGMPATILARVRDTSLPLHERWDLFAPFWQRSRTTAYGRALLIAARDLFGVPDIDVDTYEALSEHVAASNRPGWYDYVLKDRACIEVCLQHCLPPTDPAFPANLTDPRFVALVHVVDPYLSPRARLEVDALEAETDASLHTLDDLLRAIDADLGCKRAEGVVALKVGVAYSRSLHFQRTAKTDAERAWNHIFAHLGEGISMAEAEPLQNYVLHHIVRRSIDLDLPVQIHTGLQERNGNLITNSNPTLLANLFLEYPRARFDIFHGGYPYGGELSTLAKNFQNVSIDMCWLPVISPSAARDWLNEWLETVPHNKIFAFGGDYLFVEGAYAASRIARGVVADVLSAKVEQGYLSEEEGLALVPQLLHDNAWDFFRLGERWIGKDRTEPAGTTGIARREPTP